jgi:hypothetical protein
MCESLNGKRMRKALRTTLMASAFLAFTGCVMFPLPSDRHKHGSHRTIPDSKIAALTPGQTTLTEAVLSLGEPQSSWNDDTVIGYRWQKIRFELWVFGEWFGKDDGFNRHKFGRTSHLDLRFDPDGKLLKKDFNHTSFDEHTR